MTVENLSSLILRTLERTGWVEVDGLGVFARDAKGQIQFHSGNALRVFIAYAAEDFEQADKLFVHLRWLGFSPWMDRRKLLPGQNWPRRIEQAVASADCFIACFSNTSVRKRGCFQAEIRAALECAKGIPLDDVFFIPIRLDDCTLPVRIQRETQYVDMFPDWDAGLARIAGIIARAQNRNS